MKSINGTDLEVVEGDITALDVDAIVNAANGQLAHGGGLAAAISRKGGPGIQRESDAWVRQYGSVPTGKAAITSGGELAAPWVIHAVGPVYEGTTRSAELLASAVLSSLALAEERGLKSIALPAISTGIFGYPIEAAADVIVNAVVETLEAGTSLERIVLCLYGDAAYEVFVRALEGRC